MIKNKYVEFKDCIKIYVDTPNGIESILVDFEDLDKLLKLDKSVKIHISEFKTNKYARFYMNNKNVSLHRFILNPPKNKLIDHINRNGLDNRKSNLRIVERKINNQNRDMSSNNNSGYNGVHYHKKAQKWIAEISIDNKGTHLGTFKNVKDAIKVRKLAEYFYWEYLPKILKAEKDKIQDALLKLCTKLAPEIKEEVQQLFKGE